MTGQQLAYFTGMGGLAFFLYGMLLLSEGLRLAAGDSFKRLIHALSVHRLRGYLLGIVMGTSMQSSATTVMIVGFINAGLITLVVAIPLIAGANLGTSFAMQFIALDIEWLWGGLALIGLPLRIWPGNLRRQRIGQALLGLALLLLGMRLMIQSVYPFRDLLGSWISEDHPSGVVPQVLYMGGSVLFTALIQSSSATIGVVMSLARSGVISDGTMVVPLVAGAQIGTCITALISSIGTSPDARRGALAHLVFNLLAGTIIMIAAPQLAGLSARLSDDPARQVANIHTMAMIAGSLVFVPLAPIAARLMHRLFPFQNGSDNQSFLSADLAHAPSAALDAGDLELARLTRIIRRGFEINHRLMAKPGRKLYQLVKQTEDSVDLIHQHMRAFLISVAAVAREAQDSKRLQWMNLFLVYLERISDHNDNLADLSLELGRHLSPEDLAFARAQCDLFYNRIDPFLKIVEEVWTSDPEARLECARRLRELRSRYLPESELIQTEIVTRIADHRMHAIAGFLMTEYISEMDRIVRHTKKIAGLIEKSAVPA